MEYKNKRNPILPLQYHIPDSEAHVMPDGRMYIYGSFDEREDVFCSEKYQVVSTADMEHWTVHDEAFHGAQVPWFKDPDAPKYPGIDWSRPTPFIQKMIQRDLENGIDMKAKFEASGEDREEPALLFAPDCAEKDGTYYLYFCMPDDSEGVAVSKQPQGPFADPVQLPCGGIDPAVFIDDDGQAYLYWGQLYSHGVKLHADLRSFDREAIVDGLVTEEEHYFHEGSSMRKIGDTYYYVYADMERGKPTALGYSTASSPLGPFQYRGIIIDNDGCDPKSWNNHGSIACFNGQWYVFYHRCSRNMQQYRRLCIEPITINPDGSISEVKMTSQGVGAPFAPGEAIMGYQACGLKGTVYIGVNEDAGTKEQYPEKLMQISPEDEMVFRYVKSDREWSSIRLLCSGSGTVQVFMNGQEAGTIRISGETGAGTAGSAVSENTGKLRMQPGEYEAVLKVLEADGMEILEVCLE
ncbi:MAG: family 43 glycosylhydrolase [Eubacterium sp.]|nr:family 43 glycosylhydrolase [Eubacterium sp.]